MLEIFVALLAGAFILKRDIKKDREGMKHREEEIERIIKRLYSLSDCCKEKLIFHPTKGMPVCDKCGKESVLNPLNFTQ